MYDQTGFSVESQTPRQGFAIVQVAGELDFFTSPAFRSCVTGLMDDGASHLIVDFSRLDFIDSSGLGVLVVAARRAASQAVDLALVCPPEGHVERILGVTGLVRAFTVYQTREEALEAA
jgi:anti-sigma B factor antagonist